jgi:polar amino acid transport system substrate-binding protein
MSMLFIPCSFADESFSANDLTYITEQFPPYNYQEDGKLQGISVDLLEMTWMRMDANLNRSAIQVLPWKEGYQEALEKNNTVLFSTARLPQREQLFKWAGPIGPIRNVLLAKKDRNISIATQEDLKKYKIAAISDDSAVQMLLDSGIPKEDLVLENASRPIIEMLQNGSIDAWAYGDVAGIWLIQKAGANPSDFKAAYELGQTDYYYAFNRGVPDSIIQSFKAAIDYIKTNKDGNGVSDYDRILAKYIPAMDASNEQDKERARAFLDEAVSYANDNGIDRALQEFNNRSGPFVRGDLYIFAYDINGTNIAHPFKPELIGQKGLLDVNGVDVVGREIALAERGGGAMYIVFPNPVHENRDEPKLIFIEDINSSINGSINGSVNSSIYIGTGTYLSNISAYFAQEDRADLVSFVEEARDYALDSGKQRALEVFNDPKGNFAGDGRYIFAYDYEGKTLALPYQPELIGKSRIATLDPNGVAFVSQIIDIAKVGSGFTYYIYPDPSRNMTQRLKLSYVTKVDDTWLLGSGIYAEE